MVDTINISILSKIGEEICRAQRESMVDETDRKVQKHGEGEKNKENNF